MSSRSSWRATHIYFASNPYMPGTLKIGCTRRAPSDRLRELSNAEGVPASFELEFTARVNNAEWTELMIHKALARYRINRAREFFRISVADAVRAVRDAGLMRTTSAEANGSTSETTPEAVVATREERILVCPRCQTEFRLPIGIGKIWVTCPESGCVWKAQVTS